MLDVIVNIAVELEKAGFKMIKSSPISLYYNEFFVRVKDNVVSVHYYIEMYPNKAADVTVLIYDIVRQHEGYLFATGSVYEARTGVFGEVLDIVVGQAAVDLNEENKRLYYEGLLKMDKILEKVPVEALHEC